MVAGVVLFVIGITLRLGILQVAGATGSPHSPGPVAGVVSPTGAAIAGSPSPLIAKPTQALSSAEPTPEPTPEPTASATASETAGELVFADEFDVEAAWPVGRINDWTKARYDAGSYVIDASAIDLPVYLAPASTDVAPSSTLVLQATLSLVGSDVRAGLYVADAGSTRLAVLISLNGKIELIRDSAVQLDSLGTGSYAVADGPIQLAIAVTPDQTIVAIDGTVVATFDRRIDPVNFGLVVWAQPSNGVVRVDRFEARTFAAP